MCIRLVSNNETSLSLEPRAKALTFFFTHSLAVIQCLPSVVKVRNLHGNFGMYLKKQQRCSKKLGNLPETILGDDKQILEQFVVILYDRSSAVKKVNEARLDVFAHRQKPY